MVLHLFNYDLLNEVFNVIGSAASHIMMINE
jgi:hypothetical protein